ncbi:carbon monoxide dehydrogenase [Planosporangium flavigriseum]|uniref:Carbon monoxide dehydrogenase n=1 Tax=Planosporangium flavigriseum TaxID=373681 RepID=A0A8J3LU19_9ACTN|nr:SRPBCC domain-containing protein [Planosporangium flavigriseum]NJC65772.1 carbon monoxide dehydrogenase [Planosporangium flavigriseum]GIG73626.1 hypothetical protein Pfl04_20300 [Planosporangium flavigriseum]
MKLREEFQVAKPVGDVWSFFEQPERVAACLPGVENVTVVDPDNVNVRATQSLGPMKATFDAKIKINERVPGELIAFTATGRTVKGALGNVRAGVSVQLAPVNGSATGVVVEGDVVLAGALGSVGQKVVSKQAGKVTAEFARNLDIMLNGGRLDDVAAKDAAAKPRQRAAVVTEPIPAAVPSVAPQPVAQYVPAPADPWSRAAAALSLVSALVSIAVLIVVLGGAR